MKSLRCPICFYCIVGISHPGIHNETSLFPAGGKEEVKGNMMVGPSPQLELKVSPSVEARREHTSQWQNVSPVNSSIIQVDVPGGTVYVVVGRLPIDGRYRSCDSLKCVPIQNSVLADWSNEVFVEKSSSCLFNFRPFDVDI